MTMMEQVDAKLAQWITGEIVADRRVEKFNERTVVFKLDDESYYVARGFPVGTSAHVSLDRQDVTADEAIAWLMEIL